ncbi:MAG: hypothetical protein WD040_06280 [Anaerolineales bacterium]
MRHVLFLFLDGVGLGDDDPTRNPFSVAELPTLTGLLGGRKLFASSAPFDGPQASLRAADARLGMPGAPQSASGQATLLTGRNIPAEIGEHYGPKPNPAIAAILRKESVFQEVLRRGGRAALINAYPPRYFEAIESGRRLYSAIPMAAHAAGLPLMTSEDLLLGKAMAADFTGAGWAAQSGFPPAPVYAPEEAGELLARLSESYELTWFDFWPTDYAGHHGDMPTAVGLLESIDRVFAGLVRGFHDRQDLIVLSSDHGNLEDLLHRGHTLNSVPVLVVGPAAVRKRFCEGLADLSSVAPAVLNAIFDTDPGS